jgi:hypothetical protein
VGLFSQTYPTRFSNALPILAKLKLYIKQGMDGGTRYPIRFVEVVTPPKGSYDDWNEPVNMGCKVRRVCFLSVEFFEKL